MQLLTFAHYPEAEAFFAHFKPERTQNRDWLYRFDNGFIALTGEGIHEALARTMYAASLAPDLQIILNFGVAGVIDTRLNLNAIYEVRSVYAHDHAPIFKSFNLHGSHDVVTSGKRVLSHRDAEPLKTMAHLVDRELWGIAFAAKELQVPLQSYKFASDIAGTIEACEVVKARAAEISKELLEKYLALIPATHNLKNTKSELNIDGFYFTTSQKHEYHKLITKIAILRGCEIHEVDLTKMVSQIRDLKISEKRKTAALLKSLQERVVPQLSENTANHHV